MSVAFPASLEVIGDHAFYGSGLTSGDLSGTSVRTIGSWAVYSILSKPIMGAASPLVWTYMTISPWHWLMMKFLEAAAGTLCGQWTSMHYLGFWVPFLGVMLANTNNKALGNGGMGRTAGTSCVLGLAAEPNKFSTRGQTTST